VVVPGDDAGLLPLESSVVICWLFSLSLLATVRDGKSGSIFAAAARSAPLVRDDPFACLQLYVREFHPEVDWQTSGRELRNMDGPEHTSLPHCARPMLLNATRTIASWPEAP
jgi:hypothetical protein